MLPGEIGNRPLTGLQQRLVKSGGRLVTHARRCCPMVAESHLTKSLTARRSACHKNPSLTLGAQIGARSVSDGLRVGTKSRGRGARWELVGRFRDRALSAE